MLRSLVLAVALALPGGGGQSRLADPSGQPLVRPLVRVAGGEAHLAEGRAVRALEAHTGPVALASESGWLEAGALADVELVWRGLASATVHGPAVLELTREPGLRLEHAQVLELEVRRGTFAFELAGVGTLAFTAGALQVRALPDGVFE